MKEVWLKCFASTSEVIILFSLNSLLPVPLLFLDFLGIVEESTSWLKTHVWFFRPDHGLLQRLCLAGLPGAADLPTPPLVNSRSLQTLNRAASSTQVPVCRALCTIFPLLAWAASFLGLFTWGLGQRSSSGARAYGGGGETLGEPPLLRLWLSTSTFPHRARAWAFLPDFRVHKMARAFHSGLPPQWDGPNCLC